MTRLLTHLQDVIDLASELRTMLPVRLQFERDKPKSGSEYEQWVNLNAYFHVGIVRSFSKHTGMTFKESKEELQKMFAMVSDADGIVVESVGGMNLERLREFVLQCSVFMEETFGEIPEQTLTGKTKKL